MAFKESLGNGIQKIVNLLPKRLTFFIMRRLLPTYLLGVSIAVFRFSDKGTLELLVIKKRVGPGVGCQLPGGGVKNTRGIGSLGDYNLRDSASDELKQETNVNISGYAMFSVGGYTMPSFRNHINLYTFVISDDYTYIPNLRINDTFEIAGVFWTDASYESIKHILEPDHEYLASRALDWLKAYKPNLLEYKRSTKKAHQASGTAIPS